MDPQSMQILQLSASVLSGLLVLAALFLLWWKSHSPWLLVAIMAAGISLLFRLAFAVAPAALNSTPLLLLVWPLTGLVMAGGLLGYAVVESGRRSQ